MSNLYKPWFVHTESQNTRVIDSNDHIQEFLKQQMVKQDRPVGPDGFAEGIITDKTENVIPVEEPEQDMTAVNEKAEQILSQARAQADVLIDDARQEAEAIRDEAKKQGYLEGQNTLEQEYNQKKQQLEQEQQQKKIQLQNSYQEKQKNIPEGVKYLRKAADLKNLDAIQVLVGAYLLKIESLEGQTL